MKDSSFTKLVEVMAQLRSPQGCPWDREQTHTSLKPYMLEEAYESLEAIDAENDVELCAELGDVLLQVVFHAQIARERESFDIDAVCQAIVDKLVRRHPHVFGDLEVDDADTVAVNWERIKRDERAGAAEALTSTLDGVPLPLPALLRAQRIQDKASRVGFDWQHIGDPLDKVSEEFEELRRAWATEDAPARRAKTDSVGAGPDTVEEFGDLLFALVNVGRFLKVSSEDALRLAVAKFEWRFRALEERFRSNGRDLEEVDLEEMDAVWEEIKKTEG